MLQKPASLWLRAELNRLRLYFLFTEAISGRNSDHQREMRRMHMQKEKDKKDVKDLKTPEYDILTCLVNGEVP